MRREKSMPSVWIAPLTRCDSGALTDKVTEGQTIQVSSTWLSHILRFGLTGIRCASLKLAGSWRSCGKEKRRTWSKKKSAESVPNWVRNESLFFYFKFHPRRFSQPISFLYGIQWPIWRRARAHTQKISSKSHHIAKLFGWDFTLDLDLNVSNVRAHNVVRSRQSTEPTKLYFTALLTAPPP